MHSAGPQLGEFRPSAYSPDSCRSAFGHVDASGGTGATGSGGKRTGSYLTAEPLASSRNTTFHQRAVDTGTSLCPIARPVD
jgi:hypothetical protein